MSLCKVSSCCIFILGYQYTACHHAECRGAIPSAAKMRIILSIINSALESFTLNVVMLSAAFLLFLCAILVNVNMASVILLSVIMLNVIMLDAIILRVVMKSSSSC